MSPKALNLAVAGIVVALILVAGFGLYSRGKQAERADRAEEALGTLTEAYSRITKDFQRVLAADSAAEEAFADSNRVRIVVRDRFHTLVDTLAYTDTLIVRAAEEALQTCESTVLACGAALAAKDSVRANLEAQVRNLEAQLTTTRALAEARCDGKTPTWLNAVSFGAGAALGAWIRGE